MLTWCRWRVGLLLAALAVLAACGAKNNIVTHNGKEFCGYISESTKQEQCAGSGLPEADWITGKEGQVIIFDDGVDAQEHVIGLFLCDLPSEFADNLQANRKRADWLRENPITVCADYRAWKADPNYRPTPSPKVSVQPTPSPSPSQPSPSPSPKRSR